MRQTERIASKLRSTSGVSMGPRIVLADLSFFIVPVRAGSLSAAALELGIFTRGVNQSQHGRRSAWA